jgi:hypothetical protein
LPAESRLVVTLGNSNVIEPASCRLQVVVLLERKQTSIACGWWPTGSSARETLRRVIRVPISTLVPHGPSLRALLSGPLAPVRRIKTPPLIAPCIPLPDRALRASQPRRVLPLVIREERLPAVQGLDSPSQFPAPAEASDSSPIGHDLGTNIATTGWDLRF